MVVEGFLLRAMGLGRRGFWHVGRFFNTGWCSFDKQANHTCSRCPCAYRGKCEIVRAILATLD